MYIFITTVQNKTDLFFEQCEYIPSTIIRLSNYKFAIKNINIKLFVMIKVNRIVQQSGAMS